MDLHSAAAGAIGTVNPFIPGQVQRSTGYTIAVDGRQVPAYAPLATIAMQVQPLQYGDLAQMDGLNIQGERRKAWVSATTPR